MVYEPHTLHAPVTGGTSALACGTIVMGRPCIQAPNSVTTITECLDNKTPQVEFDNVHAFILAGMSDNKA